MAIETIHPAPPVAPPAIRETPSAYQRAAIEAPVGPLLVLAGPGAGKTFCLIERIRFLIERTGVSPDRICAFTFTNKAAGEIATRLRRTIGDRAEEVKTGTIHAFCAEMLREFGPRVGLERGFGIADENYQRSVLRRLGYPAQWATTLLVRFANFRFRGEALHPKDVVFFARYEEFLAHRRIVDFDMLLIKAAELVTDTEALARLSARWDCVLIDEFQDLNPVQYAIVKGLARRHRHIVAVGDDEQSIYSWAGADPSVFRDFVNDFGIKTPIPLRDNRRCPRQVLEPARRLVEINTPIFADRRSLEEGRDSPFPVLAHSFLTEDAELAWVIGDIRRQRDEHDLHWGDIALLYRKHQIGDAAEAALLAAEIPCRLAQGRAFADDPVVAYVLAAIRVIASDDDDLHEEQFLEVVLPKPLVDAARAQATGNGRTLRQQLRWIADSVSREDGDGRRIRRGFSALANLAALGKRHTSLPRLVEELLSQRVGEYRTSLEEHHDELSDPADHVEVVRLAERLDRAIRGRQVVWLPRMGGVELPLKHLLLRIGVETVALGDAPPEGAEQIVPTDALVLGLSVTLFKAAQLAGSRRFGNVFRDFTVVDIETTDGDIETAEVVDIAAVRVRNGRIVEELQSLVRPRRPISPGAQRVHKISNEAVAGQPYFETVWPLIRAFCGTDVVVAHNGYHFDFPILRRMSKESPENALCTYDTLPLARDLVAGSAKLEDLARRFNVPTGTSHRALDDSLALAQIFVALGDVKVARARKTALANLLDHLGVALALADEDWRSPEVALLRRLSRPYALGRYSDCLETYTADRAATGDDSLPQVADLIARLGGEAMLQRIRAEKTADARYPLAMARLRRLLEQCGEGALPEQIGLLLERVALSRWDGIGPEPDRVNLLTLHSTKGLEFSRVYILGVEDGQLLSPSPTRSASTGELEEARRLLYVGMTRAKDRLVLTRVEVRGGEATGGHRFLDEMQLTPVAPE